MRQAVQGVFAHIRPAAVLKLEMLSANLAIGTASAFVLVTAAASLAIDRQAPATPPVGQGWGLRGSISKIDPRDRQALRLPLRKDIARL